MVGGERRWIGVWGAALMASACRTPPPAPAPPKPPAPVKAEAPAATDPCGTDCPALAEQMLARDQVKGLRLLRACLACPNPPPARFARAADLQRGVGDKEGALHTLRAGTRAHPRAALLWQLRGRLALQLDLHKEGLDALTRARALRPDDAGLAAELADAERRHGDAEARARREVAGFLEEADARFAAQDLAGAEEALRAAFATAEGAPRVKADLHRRLAVVFVASHDTKKARDEVEAGLGLVLRPGPLRAALLLTHSDVLLGEGDAQTALISATAAAEMMPEDPLPHTNVAIARALLSQAPQAIEALRRAVDLGLPARLTKKEVLALAGFEQLAKREDFRAVIEAGWTPTHRD